MSGCCNEKESCGCEPVGLIDMTNVSLQDLASVDPQSALGRSIQKLVKSLGDPNGVISAFSNFV